VDKRKLAQVITVTSLLVWGVIFGKIQIPNTKFQNTFSILHFPFSIPLAKADEIDDLQHQIDELAKLKKLSEDATTPLEKQVTDLNSKIQAAQNGIAAAQKQSDDAGKQIAARENTIGTVYSIFSERVA